jgi:hypothetical protein
MGNGPLNYTTTIRPEKTAAECLAILGRGGAGAVAVTYADRKPTGIAFTLDTPAGQRSFDLPVNVDGVYAALAKAAKTGGIPPRYSSREQAERTAWRIIKDWLEAQVAIIDAQMASLDQVMLPYLRVGEGRSLYQAYADREGLLMLEAGHG